MSASWRVARGFSVYAGGSFSDFTKFEGLDFPPQRLAEERVASLGLEYRLQAGAHSRFVRRRTTNNFRTLLPDGQEIIKWAFTLGSGLMFRTGRGKLDAALQFGKVGSVDTNTYQDRQVRFYVSITGSENWQTKRESEA